jgi:type IV pilus biogenesis protein PilP
MSFRDVCSWAVLGFLGTGLAGPLLADEPPPVPPAECRDLDGQLLGAVDCLELEARLSTLAKIEDAKSKILDAKAKAAEAEKKRATAERPEPPSGRLPDAPFLPPTKPGRVLEIIGSEARIRWNGGEYRVRAGQRLPGGAWVVQVSLEGVTVAQGTRRETLPFVIGRGP